MGTSKKHGKKQQKVRQTRSRRNAERQIARPVSEKNKREQNRHSAGRSSGKVIKYAKPLNINIGFVIFAVILIYILISIFSYITSDKIVGYEVKTGSLSANRVYHGIALRKETVFFSDFSGNINYYNEEGDRLGKGNLAYTVDESGQVMDYVNSQTAGETVFSDEDLSALRSDIISFTSGFDKAFFSSVYDFKASVSSTTQKISSNNILNNIQQLADIGLSSSIHYGYAPDTGDVVYSIDGFEERTFEDIREADFDPAAYSKKQLENGAMTAAGDPAYKLCTDENWQIVIMVSSEEESQKLADMEYVKVRFLKNQYESWGKVSVKTGEDGKYYVCLSLNNSMVTFCGERFVDIELITEENKGLKVPNSSIVDDTFFLVPKEFITESGAQQGVLRQVYAENGAVSTEFVPASVYSESDGKYYLDQTVLRPGDVILRTDSGDTFTLSETDILTGVYNINKGYADFRKISILYSNDEYSIVDPNTLYGLSEYDYIVLNASGVLPDQFIYE